MNRFVLLSLCLSFLSITSVKSQESKNLNSLDIKLQKAIGYFPSNYGLSGNVWGGEISYSINTKNGNKEWAKKLSIRSIDLVFDYKNMQDLRIKGKSNQFGDSFSFLTGLTFSIYKNRFIEFGISPSIGLGYTNKTFFTNGNEILGSKLNLYSRAIFSIETPVSDKTDLGLNIGVLHYSNGAMRVPNDGMNIGSAGISIRRKLPSNKSESVAVKEPKIFKRHNFEFAANLGRRGVYQSKKGLYKTGLYAGYNYRFSSFASFSTGTDAVYYHRIYDPQRNIETFQSNATSLDRWRVGIAAGPDIWMGNFAIMLKYGYYLHFNSLKEDIDTYWTAGVKYNILDWFGLHAKGYIHKTEVDCIAAGLNFTL